MSGASDTIDPIDAARDDIAGSKDLIASAVEDLSQHQAWLENYRLAETKRARRVRRQELMLQAEITTKRIIRALRRFALLIARTVRATWRIAVLVSVTVARAVAAASIYLYRLARSAIGWTAPRVSALAVAAGRRISAAFAWTLRQSRALALATGRLVSAASAWTLRQSQALALATWTLISTAFAWTCAKVRRSRVLRDGSSLPPPPGPCVKVGRSRIRPSRVLHSPMPGRRRGSVRLRLPAIARPLRVSLD